MLDVAQAVNRILPTSHIKQSHDGLAENLNPARFFSRPSTQNPTNSKHFHQHFKSKATPCIFFFFFAVVRHRHWSWSHCRLHKGNITVNVCILQIHITQHPFLSVFTLRKMSRSSSSGHWKSLWKWRDEVPRSCSVRIERLLLQTFSLCMFLLLCMIFGRISLCVWRKRGGDFPWLEFSCVWW